MSSETLARAADLAARVVLEEFDAFNEDFRSITRRARRRFEERDWQSGQSDAAERLDSYEKALDRAAARLDEGLGGAAVSEPLWAAAKARFASLAASRYDLERAETFFNSVTRRMLSTVGINRSVEFFHLHPKPPIPYEEEHVYRTYQWTPDTVSTMRRILEDCGPGIRYESIVRDAEILAREIDLYTWPLTGADARHAIEVIRSIFYRNKEAYIVGRIVTGTKVLPLIIPLAHRDSGARAETILLHEADANIVFSFAYSYFFVNVDRHDALIAPGLEGAVMIAFTLPTYEFVLKVIKDRPCFLRSVTPTSKTITMEQLRERYDFVSHRDHAGRMVDTQEFENLRFKKKRFSEPLLREFEQAGTRNVEVTDEYVVLRHVYVQRKVAPLPLYFASEQDPEVLRRVLVDFGYFLKDIAASGVFPTDLFNTWNYGVTRWGRVVLYDYDDVLPLENVTFREKPLPRDDFEDIAAEEDWISVTGEEFFIDEIERYSGVPRPLRATFRSVHGDLYTIAFWRALVDQLASGEIFDVIPYDRAMRFAERKGAAPRDGDFAP